MQENVHKKYQAFEEGQHYNKGPHTVPASKMSEFVGGYRDGATLIFCVSRFTFTS